MIHLHSYNYLKIKIIGLVLAALSLCLLQKTAHADIYSDDEAAHIAELKSPDPQERMGAANWLYTMYSQRKIHDNSAVAPLISLLDDPVPMVREIVPTCLHVFKDPQILNALLDHFSDPDENVRIGIVLAIGHTHDHRAVTFLIKALNDPDVQIRVGAARALGRFRYKIAADPLFIATQDQNHAVHNEALLALGELRDPRALNPLMEMLKLSTDPEPFENQVADVLYDFGDPQAKEAAEEYYKKH